MGGGAAAPKSRTLNIVEPKNSKVLGYPNAQMTVATMTRWFFKKPLAYLATDLDKQMHHSVIISNFFARSTAPYHSLLKYLTYGGVPKSKIHSWSLTVRPWKVTWPQRERIIFQPLFFRGSKVNVAASTSGERAFSFKMDHYKTPTHTMQYLNANHSTSSQFRRMFDPPNLVGGFNPIEKYSSNWKSSPICRGEHKTYLSCHHYPLRLNTHPLKNPTRVFMEVIVTSDRKLGDFTYVSGTNQPTFIGVK